MSKHTIELGDEQISAIVAEELKWIYTQLSKDILKERPFIYVEDPEEDKKLIKKDIKALKRVLKWYGEDV